MDTLDFLWKVIESQGLVATMLAYLIYQNDKEKERLLGKICELNHFIMECLQRELDEDHNGHDGSVPRQETIESHNSTSKVELPNITSSSDLEPL